MSSSNNPHHINDPNFMLAMQNFRLTDDAHSQQPGSAHHNSSAGPVYENIEYYSSPTPSASIDHHLSHYGNFESSNKRAQPQVPTASVHNYHHSSPAPNNGQQSYGQSHPSQPHPLQHHQLNQTHHQQPHQRNPSSHHHQQSSQHYADHIPIYENLPTGPPSHGHNSGSSNTRSSGGAQPQQRPPLHSSAGAPVPLPPKAASSSSMYAHHSNDTYVPHMPPYSVGQRHQQHASSSSSGCSPSNVSPAPGAAPTRYSSVHQSSAGSGYGASGHQQSGGLVQTVQYVVAGGGGHYASRDRSPPARSNVSQQHYGQVGFL